MNEEIKALREYAAEHVGRRRIKALELMGFIDSNVAPFSLFNAIANAIEEERLDDFISKQCRRIEKKDREYYAKHFSRNGSRCLQQGH